LCDRLRLSAALLRYPQEAIQTGLSSLLLCESQYEKVIGDIEASTD